MHVAKGCRMRTLRFSVVALCSLLASGAALLHCSSDDSSGNGDTGDDSGAGDGSTRADSATGDANSGDAAPHDAGVITPGDASLTAFCKVRLAIAVQCEYPTCDDGGVNYAT